MVLSPANPGERSFHAIPLTLKQPRVRKYSFVLWIHKCTTNFLLCKIVTFTVSSLYSHNKKLNIQTHAWTQQKRGKNNLSSAVTARINNRDGWVFLMGLYPFDFLLLQWDVLNEHSFFRKTVFVVTLFWTKWKSLSMCF